MQHAVSTLLHDSVDSVGHPDLEVATVAEDKRVRMHHNQEGAQEQLSGQRLRR